MSMSGTCMGVVRVLASYKCGPGSIPGPGVICGLSLLLVFVLAPRGFCPGTPVSPLLKNTSKFTFDLESVPNKYSVAKYIDTY